MIEVGNYIDGSWHKSKGKTFQSFHAHDSSPLSVAPVTSDDEINKAVASANRAFQDPAWRDTSGAERANALFKIADELQRRRKPIAQLIAREMGKPYRISLVREVDGAIDKLRFFAGTARQLDGKVTGATKPDVLDMTVPEPVGVCALIIPWNDPVDLAVRKVGAAIAAGCTFIVKSSEVTPASTAALFEVIHASQALPRGVANLVHGPGTTGQKLVDHVDVAKISFTGSTATGKLIMERAAKRLARVSMECGGKLSAIIFADADLKRCLDALTYGAFMYSGQSCTACTRLHVERSVYEKVLNELVERSKALKVGDPMDEDVLVGPIASRAQFERIAQYIDTGLSEGATAVIGGRPGKDTNYVYPTILTGDLKDSRLAKEEIFGPVVLVHPFDSEVEVVAAANNTPYGLGGSIWTSNINRAVRVMRQLRIGDVWVNTHYVRNTETAYGGRGESGFGRELGMAGVEEYVSWKRVCIDTRDDYHMKTWFEQPAARNQ